MEAFNSGKEGMIEIVFFDLETNEPNRAGQRFWVLEFGAIVVCPQKLVELESYSTLIRPKDLSVVYLKSSRCHNIQRFDCIRIKEAFGDISRPAPEPVGMIDSLGVLTEKFGRRSGNMKVYISCFIYRHVLSRSVSLDDVRMNLEVLKHCATVLFLESSLPNVLNGKWQGSPTIMTRSRTNGKLQCREEASQKSPQISSIGYQKSVPYTRGSLRKVTERV
ncbi:hypothetical protein RGQ29_010827 [Quercus rubra]|uniref:Uncharacterized protein n=1 Tax=Quercus rubra TaxID=3512 RepID=A0AAN7FVW2_QUERU|nr:hypothetical protein RGQ29_010827 [Quercus rubra]